MSATRSIMIGDIRVSYVPDGLVQMHPRWLGGAAAQDFAAGTDCLDGEGYLAGSVGGLLVENGDRRMLIDAGFGGNRVPAHLMPDGLGQIEGGRLVEGLRELGVAPGGIEVVAFTHLHDDHIGWAVRGPADREVFAGAQFFAGEAEWRWWSGAVDPRRAQVLGRRMNPAADGREVFPGVTAWSTPGHTPGHTSYVVESGGQRLIAFGDVLHSPIQFADPRWGSANDFDRTQAVASRQAVIAELSDEKVTGFGGHFADVVFGSLPDNTGTRLRWQPVDATD
ncbi:MBL fold metallo-hydrolase [Hamadaea tsunoensis]|uniref:MBL fold metallo-hydrolase n=1 Tax=Hamadaea tsunoensis TaxID=53368 RepID=UPI000557BB35|nr:MBL fold metallo-hydrolase [Hamadaea tsunoensis]